MVTNQINHVKKDYFLLILLVQSVCEQENMNSTVGRQTLLV